MNQKTDTRKMTVLAVMAAAAYAVMLIGRIPMVLFLKYDPKDIIFILAGFIFGPLSSFLVITVVCLIEMATASDTGLIGLAMNLLSSAVFTCTAAYIYKKMRTMQGAFLGLFSGCLLMTAVMLLWNYLLVPVYTSTPREEVAGMLLPVFLPFNLLKGGINLSAALILYKPVINALRKAQLVPPAKKEAARKGRRAAVPLLAGLILLTCVLVALAMRGVI